MKVDGLAWARDSRGEYKASMKHGPPIGWAPQAGSQTAFLSCPIYETLYEGTRGPGKTDALLMDFARGVGQGLGADWRGILFRRTYPELRDVVAKSHKWFGLIFPQAKFNKQDHAWTFPDGEVLIFAFMERARDYDKYHGHAYPWIGWEELTNWATDECFTLMMSTSRSTNPRITSRVRATCNPYGPGHNWVKLRYGLPIAAGRVATPIRKTSGEPDRVAIHGDIRENLILLDADPEYINKIRASASGNAAKIAAWLDGSWDITSGGMFDDLWDRNVHLLSARRLEDIPKGWRIDRSYDHGQSRPFSVGWWAESNGEPWVRNGEKIGTVRGDLIRVAEWYGCTGKPNEGLRMSTSDIASGIRERQTEWHIASRVKRGPADSSIFDETEPGKSIGAEMARKGVHWTHADKRAGSRKHGWERLRELLRGAIPVEGTRERPGLFVFDTCRDFVRTFPALSRDERDPDDVDTRIEDHIADEARYRVRFEVKTTKIRRNAQVY